VNSLPKSPHRPVKGIRLPNLRGGWLKTGVGRIAKNKRRLRKKDKIFIFISLWQRILKVEDGTLSSPDQLFLVLMKESTCHFIEILKKIT
jgi:hypothetical protein